MCWECLTSFLWNQEWGKVVCLRNTFQYLHGQNYRVKVPCKVCWATEYLKSQTAAAFCALNSAAKHWAHIQGFNRLWKSTQSVVRAYGVLDPEVNIQTGLATRAMNSRDKSVRCWCLQKKIKVQTLKSLITNAAARQRRLHPALRKLHFLLKEVSSYM